MLAVAGAIGWRRGVVQIYSEAASQCGVTQPRMKDLLRGRTARFSPDALVDIATALGRRVHVELKAA